MLRPITKQLLSAMLAVAAGAVCQAQTRPLTPLDTAPSASAARARLAAFQGQAADDHEHDAHEHDHAALPDPFGFDLRTAWLDPWVHRHFSRRGTPYVHTFLVEPAFIDRDLFLDYGSTTGPSGDEFGLAAELEWGLTRRLGVAVEAQVLRLEPHGAPDESGIGDVAVAPRALLVETDRFLAAANLEVGIPTGDDERGLGSGEVSLGPSLSFWIDVGHSVQASIQVGNSTGLDSGLNELFYGVAGSYTLGGPTPFAAGSSAFIDGHFAPGMTSVIVEYAGQRALDGPDSGTEASEILYGLSYVLTGFWELRGAYRTSVSGSSDFDDGYLLSAIFHF